MTTRTSRRCALAAALALGALTTNASGEGQAADKTIYVSVLDEAGKPVKDLTTKEFKVREDGVDREVVGASLAGDPLCVALLVDTTQPAEPYIRDIRTALTAFAKQITTASPGARITVFEFGQASVPLVPFTSDMETLERQIGRLYPKKTPDGVLLEALMDATSSLNKQNSRRRAVVVLSMEPGRERSTEQPQRIQDAFQRSGAQLWTVSLRKGQGLADNSIRDLVLNTVGKNTGGHREFIVGQTAIETYLTMYADALASQYAVTYKRPASERPKVVQTGVTRTTPLRLHASLFAPQ